MKEIGLPETIEGVQVATVVRWFRSAGDVVRAGDPLVRLETDQGFLLLDSRGAGRIRELRAEEGSEVVPGSVLALMEPMELTELMVHLAEQFRVTAGQQLLAMIIQGPL